MSFVASLEPHHGMEKDPEWIQVPRLSFRIVNRVFYEFSAVEERGEWIQGGAVFHWGTKQRAPQLE